MKVKTGKKTIVEVEEVLDVSMESYWWPFDKRNVPVSRQYLVIPTNQLGKWIGPPVLAEGASSQAAVADALTNKRFGFAETPTKVFVVCLGAKATMWLGQYVSIHPATTRRAATLPEETMPPLDNFYDDHWRQAQESEGY
jgi:hypothetical protein